MRLRFRQRGRERAASAAEGDRGYALYRDKLRPGNRVTTLRSGKETFPSMLEAIRGARSHVHLESYIVRDDRIGREFKLALVERARAGVQVRLIVDALGSFGLPSAYLDELRDVGVETIEFHPIAPWRARWGVNKRDHQKILVVDDRVAFTGGINIGDEYQPIEEQGGGWFDMHVRVEGPAVFDLARLFRATWIKNGGELFPEPAMTRADALPDGHTAFAQVISNTRLRARYHMRRSYLHAIRRAQERISIMNAYFIPDRGLRRAFARAVQRGVEVRVIVPSSAMDIAAVYYASRYVYSHLMRDGVRIFEWRERMMHAKCGVIDRVWSTIGSYNLDRRSLLHNFEVSLIVIDRNVGTGMDARFDEDLASSCREVQPEHWERRSIWSKCLEWMCFQIRYWL
jgi:cardiolipin synthase